MDLFNIKQSIAEDYDLDLTKVDIYFHNTNQQNLNEYNFRFTADTKGTDTVGMFAHMGNDDHFDVYGGRLLAVVVDRSIKILVRPVDDTHNNDSFEAFIPRTAIQMIEEL